MDKVLEILETFILSVWNVLYEASPYMLFGFFIAGLLKAYVSPTFFSKHLSGKGILPVLKGTVIGIPLPLCSCGVIPTAIGLRKQGAGKGATTAFMIATPETGVDSIAISYALLGPVMTILRPVAATLTAIVAGLGVDYLLKDKPDELEKVENEAKIKSKGKEALGADKGQGQTAETSCGASQSECKCESPQAILIPAMSAVDSSSAEKTETCQCSSENIITETGKESASCCSSETTTQEPASCCSSNSVATEPTSCCSSQSSIKEPASCCSSHSTTQEATSCCSTQKKFVSKNRFLVGMHFSFIEMMDDIGKWFLLGVLFAGLLGIVLPVDFFDKVPGGDITSMFMMLIIGIPLYICSTASTPIVAALLLKGLSPGAALIFLLAGPATNIATITVVSKIMGKGVSIIYLASITLCTLLFGFIVNMFYSNTTMVLELGEHTGPLFGPWVNITCAVILIANISLVKANKIFKKIA